MEYQLPLGPVTGDIVIAKRARVRGYELAVRPHAAGARCDTYDRAWTVARAFAEQKDVDFWYARYPSTTAHDAEGTPILTLLGHYRR